MFDSYLKPAMVKAGPEPVPRPWPPDASAWTAAGAAAGSPSETLRAAIMPGFGQGILGLAEQRLAEEERRRLATAGGSAAGVENQAVMAFPGRPSPLQPLPGPASQPPRGMPGYDPAWTGLAPGAPRPFGYVMATGPAYGYQDQTAVRNSGGL